MARTEAEALAPVVREDLRERVRAILDLLACAHALEDLLVLVDGRRLDADLVADAPQEGLVDEVGRVEVRREHDEHVEGDLDLLPGVERQVVDALLERDDPTVEEILGRDALAAEVVDHEDPAIGLHLEGRLVHLRGLVPDEVERVERELATGHDDRTARDDPTVVVAQALRDGGVDDRPVVDLVVELDDLLVDLDRVREDDLALEQGDHDLGDRRLAVAGRAEEEDRFPGVDGRPELRERVARDDHGREGP